MKIYTRLALPTITLIFCQNIYANSGYALINDKDGFVNLRSDDNLQSDIIKKIPNKTMVSANCSSDYTDNKNFCFIVTSNNTTGYIYKNRLVFLDNNNNFVKINFNRNKDGNIIIFNNNKYNINGFIKLIPADINISKINNLQEHNCSTTYKGGVNYGLNKDMENFSKYYLFEKILLRINNKEIVIPKNKMQGLYISDYAVNNNEAFDYTYIYYNIIEHDMYVISKQAYGALTYSVIFKENNNNINRYTWCEAS